MDKNQPSGPTLDPQERLLVFLQNPLENPHPAVSLDDFVWIDLSGIQYFKIHAAGTVKEYIDTAKNILEPLTQFKARIFRKGKLKGTLKDYEVDNFEKLVFQMAATLDFWKNRQLPLHWGVDLERALKEMIEAFDRSIKIMKKNDIGHWSNILSTRTTLLDFTIKALCECARENPSQLPKFDIEGSLKTLIKSHIPKELPKTQVPPEKVIDKAVSEAVKIKGKQIKPKSISRRTQRNTK